MPKPARTKPVSSAQVRAYAGKADEFATAAASEVLAGRFVAATSLAIHAGINAADAVCGARLGILGPLVRITIRYSYFSVKRGPNGAQIEKELRRLLPLKTKAEYEPDDVAPSVATKAAERAERLCASCACTVAGALQVGAHLCGSPDGEAEV